MENTIIHQVLVRNSVITILVLVAIVAVFFLIRWTVKNEIFPKWSYAVYFSVSIVAIVVMCVGLSRIYLDIKNEDYVVYHGEYIERGGGQSELKTVVVRNELGREIRLLRTGPSEIGTYYGTVVYGKRSNIIVEYSGSPTT